MPVQPKAITYWKGAEVNPEWMAMQEDYRKAQLDRTFAAIREDFLQSSAASDESTAAIRALHDLLIELGLDRYLGGILSQLIQDRMAHWQEFLIESEVTAN